MKRRSQTCDDNWQQSLLKVVVVVNFHYKSCPRIWQLCLHDQSIKSQHFSSQATLLKVLFDRV